MLQTLDFCWNLKLQVKKKVPIYLYVAEDFPVPCSVYYPKISMILQTERLMAVAFKVVLLWIFSNL